MAGKRLTKSQVVSELAELTELDKKSINKVFDGLTEIIRSSSAPRPRRVRDFGLLKLRRWKKLATKIARTEPHEAAHHHQGQAGVEENPRFRLEGAEGSHPVGLPRRRNDARRRVSPEGLYRHGSDAGFVQRFKFSTKCRPRSRGSER